MKNIKNLRILHFLSPVRWSGNTFLNEIDSNWKVAKKTIDWLPECHHYIISPLKHSIQKQSNITFIPYDYPKSVLLNRVVFDHRNIDLNFETNDFDFVFNHQPEHLFSLKSWFDSKRYNHTVGFFSFFHWIDCDKSRSSVSPPSYFRQLDSFIFADKNFIHSKVSLDYFNSNFSSPQVNERENISFMPLSTSRNTDTEPFEIPDKKIIIFNHRWNKSTGVERLKKYISKYDFSNYIFWFTDESSDISGPNIIKKTLNPGQYNYLLSKCFCSICFVDDYCTWNLSCQDSIKFGKPSICYKHPTILKILGEDYPFYFKDFNSFTEKISTLKDFNPIQIDFDTEFKNNLIESMNQFLEKHKNRNVKYIDEFKNQIINGKQFKKEILNTIRPNIKFSGADAPLRRVLMNDPEIIDDFNSTIPKYSYINKNSTKNNKEFKQIDLSI